MKYKLKEDFAAVLATYCGNKKGTYLYWVKGLSTSLKYIQYVVVRGNWIFYFKGAI